MHIILFLDNQDATFKAKNIDHYPKGDALKDLLSRRKQSEGTASGYRVNSTANITQHAVTRVKFQLTSFSAQDLEFNGYTVVNNK